MQAEKCLARSNQQSWKRYRQRPTMHSGAATDVLTVLSTSVAKSSTWALVHAGVERGVLEKCSDLQISSCSSGIAAAAGPQEIRDTMVVEWHGRLQNLEVRVSGKKQRIHNTRNRVFKQNNRVSFDEESRY
jgi:hypothetical protein